MLLTSAIFVSALTDPDGGAGWSPNLVVFDFITLPLALVFHIFGEPEQIDPPVRRGVVHRAAARQPGVDRRCSR